VQGAVAIVRQALSCATSRRANGIRRLALFGSVLRGENTPASDVNLLVEFQEGRTPGLLRMAELELAKQVSHDLREPHPEVPWSAAARMRDRLVHHYFDINLDVPSLRGTR
jgi:predicted nucleotidyltransferase